MAKRAVVRKVVKWGGLAASALLAVAWVGSCWYFAQLRTSDDRGIVLHGGRLFLAGDSRLLSLSEDVGLKPLSDANVMQWWFDWGQWPGGWSVEVPLWIPLLLVVGATAAAWRADTRERRRQRVGSCPACGYDRRGLEAGKVCPECGAAAGGESTAKPDA